MVEFVESSKWTCYSDGHRNIVMTEFVRLLRGRFADDNKKYTLRKQLEGLKQTGRLDDYIHEYEMIKGDILDLPQCQMVNRSWIGCS